MNANTSEMINNISFLHQMYGARLSTKKKWIIAYWQKIDKVSVENGKISVDDIINNATNPSDILNCLELYRILRQTGGI